MRKKRIMGLRIRDWVVSFARQLAIDCALIATAFGVAVAAQLIEPLFKEAQDTLRRADAPLPLTPSPSPSAQESIDTPLFSGSSGEHEQPHDYDDDPDLDSGDLARCQHSREAKLVISWACLKLGRGHLG
jgi:hypothetical protein